MSLCTRTPEGFIVREQNNNSHRPNYTLWHLSMPEVELNPTEFLEPLIRFNWTGNPCLARWRTGYEKEKEWVIALVNELVDTPNSLNLIPRILTALYQDNQEPNFIVPQTPHNSEEISFMTQDHIFPRHVLLQEERTLSLTYLVLLEFISGL